MNKKKLNKDMNLLPVSNEEVQQILNENPTESMYGCGSGSGSGCGCGCGSESETKILTKSGTAKCEKTESFDNCEFALTASVEYTVQIIREVDKQHGTILRSERKITHEKPTITISGKTIEDTDSNGKKVTHTSSVKNSQPTATGSDGFYSAFTTGEIRNKYEDNTQIKKVNINIDARLKAEDTGGSDIYVYCTVAASIFSQA